MRLPAVSVPIRVDRMLPVDEQGIFQYGRRDGADPGWVGVLEKAIAAHVAGDYRFLQRGFARFGFELLLGERVHSQLRMPSAAQIITWRDEGGRSPPPPIRSARVFPPPPARCPATMCSRWSARMRAAVMCTCGIPGALISCWCSMPAASAAGSSRWM